MGDRTTNTTTVRTPTVLHFDRMALADEIQQLQMQITDLENSVRSLREKLDEKQRKMNQIALIAVSRLRRGHG